MTIYMRHPRHDPDDHHWRPESEPPENRSGTHGDDQPGDDQPECEEEEPP
jgi:hypothetical protein